MKNEKLYNEIINKYYKNTNENIYNIVEIIIRNNKASDNEKEFLKDYSTSLLNDELEYSLNLFQPYRDKFRTNITHNELEIYNEMKDNISNIKEKISSIHEVYKYKDFEKELDENSKHREILMKELEELKKV